MHEDGPVRLLEKFRGTGIHESLANERVLFLLNREIGLAPYTHEFVPGQQDSQIMSGFISALGSYLNEMTGEVASQWKTVYGPDSTMIVQNGDWVTGVISVAQDTIEIRSKLRRIVQEFETTFQFLRDSGELDGSLFSEFDDFVRRVFSSDRISASTLIYDIVPNINDIQLRLPSIKYKVTKLLEDAQDWQTVAEISRIQGLGLDETIEIISHAYWGGALSLLYVPHTSEILMPSNESRSILFHSTNPTGVSQDTLRVVGALDGKVTVGRLLEFLKIKEPYPVLLELGYLLNRGLLRRISLEEKFALIEECKASKIFTGLAKEFGIREVSPVFRDIVHDGMNVTPWISFLKLYVDGKVTYHRTPDLNPEDIDAITNALSYLVTNVIDPLKEIMGEDYAERLIQQAEAECQERFQHLFDNIVV